MTEEIKEILDRIETASEIFDCLLKPEECTELLNYITNLEKENELHNKILKDANDVLNIQAQKGNYTYDSYMLGLYNGMEMIVSLFEQREPKLKSGKDIKFLHETDYKSRNEKAVENAKEKIKRYESYIHDLKNGNYPSPTVRQERQELIFRIREQEDLINILKGGDE